MQKLKKKSWFAVRTLYLSENKSTADTPKKFKQKSLYSLEERILLIREFTIDLAVKRAVKEARDYSKYSYINIYHQKVVTKYLEIYDTFELFEYPKDMIEVFSATDVYREKKNAISVAKSRLGPKLSKKNIEKMRSFFFHQ